ncbi:ATP-binding protein [Streptomyces leeuwenhoekii]|uniref:ATP-binding protein n=1 Tax=Streptomyces leeuwenhoekii TaxID=1437453 RepID=UPI0036C1029E
MTMADTVDTDAARHLTTREGRRAFASQRPPTPALLSEDEYAALPGAELDRYNEDRLAHHARLLVVATSTVRHTVASGRRLILLNRHAVSARRGLIISGPAGTGKTIAITQLGLAHELQDRARHPDVDDRIPVVYVTVPPAATPRTIAAEFARFLGLPTTRRFNITDIIDSVVGVCTKARTGLVLVDELHNISLTSGYRFARASPHHSHSSKPPSRGSTAAPHRSWSNHQAPAPTPYGPTSPRQQRIFSTHWARMQPSAPAGMTSWPRPGTAR